MGKDSKNRFISEVVKLLSWILIISVPVLGYAMFSNIGLVIGIVVSIGLVIYLIIRSRSEYKS